MTSENHPVLVAASERANLTGDAEPISMMVEASESALSSVPGIRDAISLVAVVKGINPYLDPGRLIASQLHLSGNETSTVETAYTPIGGNAPYDLLNDTAARIAAGELDAAIVCGAETMRTRRKDKAAGRTSPYLPEAPGASPDRVVGSDAPLTDAADIDSAVALPANFYAMAESALRHRAVASNEEHLIHISELWARASQVAATNPHARIGEALDSQEIAANSADNRRIAAPYTKRLTSNVDVDQASALVVCSYRAAKAAGVDDDEMVFLLAGTGASDTTRIRSRLELDRSNAMRIAGERALELADLSIEELDHLDLYSCFPVAVQVAQHELDIPVDRPFTITGGMTFAGGPFNTYCLQAAAHAFELLSGSDETALLHGNGGYFTKEAFVVLSGTPPSGPFHYERPQAVVDAKPNRPPSDEVPAEATIEAYTVTFNREDEPLHAILSVLDTFGSRHWAIDANSDDVARFLAEDLVGWRVALSTGDGTAAAALI